MIKVNLGTTRIESIENLEGVSIDTNRNSEVRDIVVKLVIIFIGLVALKIYEGQNSEHLTSELNRVNGEISQLQATLQQKNDTLGSLGTIERDSKSLQDKLKLLKTLSRLRLREVKSLDYIQSVVPQRVWLQSLEMQGESLIIRGVGHDQPEVSLLVKRLESGGYFSDVILVEDSSMKGQGATARQFEISARTGVVN